MSPLAIAVGTVIALSVAVAVAAILADLTAWIARSHRSEEPPFSSWFRGWPLVLAVAASLVHPDLVWRIVAGAFALRHLALLILARRSGRLIGANGR